MPNHGAAGGADTHSDELGFTSASARQQMHEGRRHRSPPSLACAPAEWALI
jgi:hypothetical protein